MATKQFKEFLVEFPAEYRHAHPVFDQLSKLIHKVIINRNNTNNDNNNITSLLEFGSGFGEHALYFSHLIQQGALAAVHGDTKKSDNNNGEEENDHQSSRYSFYESLQTKTDSYTSSSSSSSSSNNTSSSSLLLSLIWQPTEVSFNMKQLTETYAKWSKLAPPQIMKENILPPLELDVNNQQQWENISNNNKSSSACGCGYDLIMSINTFHIFSEQHGYSALEGIGKVLKKNSSSFFFTYGPFRINGKHTCESNVKFDAFLKQTYSPESGIRDIDALKSYAEEKVGLTVKEVVPMPEDNFIVIFGWK